MKQNSKEEFPLGLDFFSLFVHELKSPLMSLNFQLENLNPQLKTKESKDILRTIDKDMIRLFQFVEDGLNMKELEQDFPLNLKWHTWSDVLNGIQEEMSAWLAHKKIHVVITESSPLQVYMDSKWMRIALKNLLLNAIQYSPENSSIQLQTQMRKNQDLFFSIKDEGAGVPNHLKEKVFHRFQSLHSSENLKLKGTGLGLYFSKWIVEKHGGKIQLLSSSSAGSVFAFTLPKACKELLEAS